MATLTLNGLAPAESFVTATRGPHTIKRGFRWKSTPTVLQEADCYPVFNLTSDTINGVPFRAMNDDTSPAFIDGAHLGANHAIVGGRGTHMSHGKTNADIGSVWACGAVQCVFIRPLGTNQVLLARIGSDTAPPTGTYTHVSGAANTANLVIAAVVPQPFHPMIANYCIRPFVDDSELGADTGTWSGHRVSFMESYDVLARDDVLNWFDTNGAAGGVALAGSPLFSVVNTHVFDHEANLTTYHEFLGRNAATLGRLYGVQVQLAGATHLYIPKALPFVHDGVTKDYSLIYPATPPTTEVVFDTSNTEPGGLYLDRFVTMNPSYGMVCGFAPIQDAEPVRRREIVTGPGLSIATSGKAYMSAVSMGGHAIVAGDRYAVTSFRNPIVRNAKRTLSTTVRTREADFFYADWHNASKIDLVPIPADLVGRKFSVVEKSSNVEVLSGSLNGSILADVSASGGYGYLVLRIEY